jgi:outer membrane protein OmpA-like peptidoglycan-associated protein
MFNRLYPFVLVALAVLLGAQPVEAQIWDKVKEAAKRGAERAVERETARRADRAVTEAFGLAEDAVVCAVTDETCIEEAQSEGQDVVVVDEEGEPLPASQQPSVQAREQAAAVSGAAASGGNAPMRPGEGVWANYDFVPGQRVLFADDFGDEYVGDFPRRLDYTKGNVEVVEWEGRRLLRGTGGDRFAIPLGEPLPDRFTVEFDIHDPATEGGTKIYFGEVERPSDYEGPYVNIGSWRGSGVWQQGVGQVSTNAVEQLEEEVVPIRIAVDGGYVKVYAAEQRIANVPQADLGRADAITFVLASRADRPIYLGDLRVAEGGRDRVYERLTADGRYVTRGILFDTGSATIRPESTPTLKGIARALGQDADLRLRIEGHTDNTGSADANLELSERRAAAVRDYLVQQEKIDAGRLEAAGMGQTAPVADNATPEGRQTNRRVELVVL